MQYDLCNNLDELYDDENSYGGFVPMQKNRKKQKETEVKPSRDKYKQDWSKLREAIKYSEVMR